MTCWEIFSGGKIPYGGLSPLSIPKMLKGGERMEAPDNAACSQEMYIHIVIATYVASMLFCYSILSYTATRQ